MLQIIIYIPLFQEAGLPHLDLKTTAHNASSAVPPSEEYSLVSLTTKEFLRRRYSSPHRYLQGNPAAHEDDSD